MNRGEIGHFWSHDEIDVTVESYFRMLRQELTGKQYNKAEENRRVQAVTGRSKGAVEFKHCNISAVLQGLKSFYIEGYKPRANVQGALREAVVQRWVHDSDLHGLMLKVADEPIPDSPDCAALKLVEAPTVEVDDYIVEGNAAPFDYVKIEAEKLGLKQAGKLAVVEFEQQRLRSLGLDRLAERVEGMSPFDSHVVGYDVLSFDVGGRERYISVKTTRRVREWPFLVGINEVRFSREEAERYHLYRVFRFGAKQPELYTIQGALDNSCTLEPRLFEARPRAV
ncbi:DUF3883 domain-containing protein [Arthrobacter mangrovi]|uniref:Protein NO VEIN C-terminal domain-containing protein n=1 Tax=Arthrobacter mangrovi TaxID=2966350 RepID=A0ABQ5MPK8_9MICC|nr:DUF3883 domain-containing protein [Arthrobacter mangrovi]GLB65930.1 hypothetical protein AHIS1636_03690 [Arthrobacter mangrovi]